MKIRNQWLFVLMALWMSGQAWAESRYITDMTYVPFRAGPGNEFRILHRGLKSGTELMLLEEDTGNGFTKVKWGDKEGYIRSQYLVKDVPALKLLPGVQKKAEQGAAENKQLKQQLAEREAQLKDLTTKLTGSEGQLVKQKAEMRRIQEITADPMAIDRRNRQLVEENLQLKNQVQVLQGENNQLVRDNKIKWYLYGGGTILLGIILGLILPMVRVRKKASSDWV